ncbi:MAG: hypothetical protein K9J27_06900 [Bacteroidales bacterium]|nr:hypothetical protein [Bacteroidales bacterium]MCF8333708.1 hypothetical protein [Bacteroidales bacterium]
MKTKLIILLSIIFTAPQLKGQFLLDDCNPVVKAVKDVVYIVRQDYALEDENGDLFGQGGNNYFGYACGPAVAVDSNVYFGKYTHKPYLIDKSYKEYGKGYSPVSTNVYLKGLKEDKMKDRKAEVKSQTNYASIAAIDSMFITNKQQSKAGKDKKCIVVTFLADDTSNLETSHYELSYLNNTVKWNGSIGLLSENRLGDKAVFGLLFYENAGKGQVNYELGGFVDKIENQWVVTKYQKLEPINASGGLKKIKADSTETTKDTKQENEKDKDKKSIWPWKNND